MKPELLSDIWSVLSDHIPEKLKADVAQEYITTLLDYGVDESTLQSMTGIDTYLDTAIEYAVDEESVDDDDWEE
jgi:hypothetical protein